MTPGDFLTLATIALAVLVVTPFLGRIPVDLITTSASGLDPDISPAAAEYQVARVAEARGMSEADVRAAVLRHTEKPLLGFLGQARVNVLLLNLDLDGLLAG